MIFIMNTEGTVTSAVSSPLYQGSDDVNEIVLLAPFATTTVVMVSFRLPNGQYVYPYFAGNENSTPYTATIIESLEGKFFAADGTTGYNAWLLKVDYPLTQFSGELDIQFMLTLASGGYLTSSVPMVTVGRGIPYLPPSLADDEALGSLHTAVSAAQAAQANAESANTLATLARDAAIGAAERAANSEIAALDAKGNAESAADRAEAAANSAENIASTLTDLEATLNAIIELQDYYTGATFDELHEYAEAIEQGGVT